MQLINGELKFKDDIISFIAQEEGNRIKNKVIKELRSMKELLSGDDSGLKNTWEEICVQVQGEESFYWETYLSVMRQIIEKQLNELDNKKINALWLQTDEGIMYDWDEDEGWSMETVVEYILIEYVLCDADKYTNKEIRRYLKID